MITQDTDTSSFGEEMDEKLDAETLVEVLHNLGAITTLEAASRQRLSSLLESFEDTRMAPYLAAADKWEADKVDELDPLLTDAALAGLDPYQLAQVGSMLFAIPERFEQGTDLLDRAILAQPDREVNRAVSSAFILRGWMVNLGRVLVDLEVLADEWRCEEAVNVIVRVEDEPGAGEITPIKLLCLWVQFASLG